jgi:hypothetical protein
MDPDSYDNPAFRGSSLQGPSFKGNCDIVAQDGDTLLMKWGPGEANQDHFPVIAEAINGLNFGDGITDNERMGMTKFVVPTDHLPGFPTYGLPYPLDASDYYECMQGIWPDGTMRIYGGNGHPAAGGYGPVCRFSFPGLSDTCLWGTKGITPNGPLKWSEETTGNLPGNRRATGSCGPFTFLPGAVHELDLAFIWARSYTPSDSSSSVSKLRQVADTVRRAFVENRNPCGGVIYGVQEYHAVTKNNPIVYPNPVHGFVNVEWPGFHDERTVFNLKRLDGKTVFSFVNHFDGKLTLDLAGVQPGFYLLVIRTQNEVFCQKVLKR